MRARTWAWGLGVAVAVVGVLAARIRTVEIVGESMLPTLRPGDWVAVHTGPRVRAGDVVVARHPEEDGLLVVKRAVRREEGGWWLESDNQRAAGRVDSWDFGAVADELVLGRVVLRYWPLVRGRPPGSS